MDKNGTILRGVPNTNAYDGAPWEHQIASLELRDTSGVVRYATNIGGANNIFYFQGLFSSRDDTSLGSFIDHPFGAGFYVLRVNLTIGGVNNAAGIFDHRDDLGLNRNYIEQGIIIILKI